MTIKTIIVDLDRTLARPLRAVKQYCEIVDFDAMVVSNGARVVCGNQRKEYVMIQVVESFYYL